MKKGQNNGTNGRIGILYFLASAYLGWTAWSTKEMIYIPFVIVFAVMGVLYIYRYLKNGK